MNDISTDEKFTALVFSSSFESEKKEFHNCTFIQCDFSNRDLLDCKFFDVTFTNCNFANSKYSSTQFRDCTFDHCKLTGMGINKSNFAFSADFFDCDLQYSDFSELNLSKKKFYNCNLLEARFMDCDLTYSKFHGSDLKKVLFHKCNVSHAEFLDMENVYIDPQQNTIKKTKIDMLTANTIVGSFGFVVG